MIPRRPFGRTGHLSSATLFGGAALARASQDDADRTLDVLLRFDFDAVLMPYNFFMAANERYRQSFEEVLTICRERNVAVQIIKSIARGPWATTDRTHTTWYQPLEAQADIDAAVHWVLGELPSAFLNSAGDLRLLPKVLEAADRFERRPSDAAMAAMVESRRLTSLFGLPT